MTRCMMLSLVTGRGLLSWQRLLCGVDDAVYDVVIGNREWMKRSGLIVEPEVNRTMKKLEVTGQTVVLCTVNGQ